MVKEAPVKFASIEEVDSVVDQWSMGAKQGERQECSQIIDASLPLSFYEALYGEVLEGWHCQTVLVVVDHILEIIDFVSQQPEVYVEKEREDFDHDSRRDTSYSLIRVSQDLGPSIIRIIKVWIDKRVQSKKILLINLLGCRSLLNFALLAHWGFKFFLIEINRYFSINQVARS